MRPRSVKRLEPSGRETRTLSPPSSQREACRIGYDDPVCDRDRDRARRFGFVRAVAGRLVSARAGLPIVCCGDGMRERRRHRARDLEAGRRFRVCGRRHWSEPPRCADGVAARPSIIVRASARPCWERFRCVAQSVRSTGVFIGLREVRGRMSENEYETARLERAGQRGLGRGICSCLGSRERGRNRSHTDCDGEGSEADALVECCAHNPILGCKRQWDSVAATRAARPTLAVACRAARPIPVGQAQTTGLIGPALLHVVVPTASCPAGQAVAAALRLCRRRASRRSSRNRIASSSDSILEHRHPGAGRGGPAWKMPPAGPCSPSCARTFS